MHNVSEGASEHTGLTVGSGNSAFYARVLKVLCISSISVAVPFGIYHLLYGNAWVTLAITPVVVAQSTALLLLRLQGFTSLAAHIVAIVQLGGATSYVFLLGTPALYWIFASAVANFFIVRWPSAVTLNALACLAALIVLYDEPEFIVRFALSFLLVNIFLYAFSVHLERKTRDLEKSLQTDSLTGAGNRLALARTMQRVSGQLARHQTPVSMLILDIDHYKRVNDQFGHSVGDRVLKTFTSALESRLRNTDSLYRFGGEEFVIIAENTGIADAQVLAEAIRKRINANDFPPVANLSVSIGVAQLEEEESTESWLRRADQALYQAKQKGRDRVCTNVSKNTGDTCAYPGEPNPV